MRTNDDNDVTFKHLKDQPGLQKYDLVAGYPFADLYEIKPQYADYVEQVGAALDKEKAPSVSSVGTEVRQAWQSGFGWLASHIVVG
jgi:hypothetical protein